MTFDGTIVQHQFPAIGEPIEKAFEVMKALQDSGRYHLILWTCREDGHHDFTNYPNRNMASGTRPYLTEAAEFCLENGIEFRSVNETHPDDEFRENGGRKAYADIYIDDRNLGGFPGWDFVRKVLLEDYQCELHISPPS